MVKNPFEEYRTAEEKCAQSWETVAIGLLPDLPPHMQQLRLDRMDGPRFGELSYIVEQYFKLPRNY